MVIGFNLLPKTGMYEERARKYDNIHRERENRQLWRESIIQIYFSSSSGPSSRLLQHPPNAPPFLIIRQKIKKSKREADHHFHSFGITNWTEAEEETRYTFFFRRRKKYMYK